MEGSELADRLSRSTGGLVVPGSLMLRGLSLVLSINPGQSAMLPLLPGLDSPPH